MAHNIDKIKVIIADSHFLITRSLQIILNETGLYNVIGVATSLSELNTLLKNEATVLITDFATIDYNGLDGLAQVLNSNKLVSVLVLTNNLDKNDINALHKIGIKNVAYKSTDQEELLMAVEATHLKRKYYSEDIFELLIEDGNQKVKTEENSPLTNSEMDIVRFITDGLTTKEIALRKNISFYTVMSHRKNIFRKLKINSSSELIIYAIKAGWIDNIEYYI